MTFDQRPSRQLGDRCFWTPRSMRAEHAAVRPEDAGKSRLEHVPEYRACDQALEAIGRCSHESGGLGPARWDRVRADVQSVGSQASQEDVAHVELDGACMRAAKLLGWSASFSQILWRTVKMRSEELRSNAHRAKRRGARRGVRWLTVLCSRSLLFNVMRLDGGLAAKSTRFVGFRHLRLRNAGGERRDALDKLRERVLRSCFATRSSPRNYNSTKTKAS